MLTLGFVVSSQYLQAATVEDFIGSMEKESQQSLRQFYHWYLCFRCSSFTRISISHYMFFRYDQAGTPEIRVTGETYDDKAHTYTLTLSQATPSTPGQPSHTKKPFLIPFTVGLLNQ